MIIITKATESKSKKQFEYGVRIDFSLQYFLDLRALGVLGTHEWLSLWPFSETFLLLCSLQLSS